MVYLVDVNCKHLQPMVYLVDVNTYSLWVILWL